MRDVAAGVLAIFLVIVALRLATSLTRDRRNRKRQLQDVQTRGQIVLAEIPTDDGLTLFTEDSGAFHYGDRSIPKPTIKAARVLINGAPIAASIARGYEGNVLPAEVVEDRPDGLSRDRWDVSIDTGDDTVLVECGAIRERISQDLARRVFGAVKGTIESGDR